MSRTFALLAVVGLSLSAFSAPALADEPPLKGPKVQDRNVPGVDARFSEEGREGARRGAVDRLPPRVFRDALDVVLASDAPANLRVADDKRQTIETLISDFEQSSRAYAQQNREKMQELRKKAGEFNRPKRPGQPAEGANSEKPGAGGESIAAREELRTLMAGAPKVEDVQTKIWAELNAEQQKAVDAKLQEFRDKASEMRQDQYVKQKLGSKGGGGAAGPAQGEGAKKPGPAGAGGGERLSPERRERLMQLLSRMTPEQQDELIRRLEARVSGTGETGDRPATNRSKGQRKKQPGETPEAPKSDADPMQPQNP